jgi:hypothetical protein
MTITIKRVGILSAFRVGFGLNIVVFAIFAIFVLVMQLLGISLGAVYRPETFRIGSDTVLGLGSVCLFFFITAAFGGFVGGFVFAIYALIYNLAVGLVGGLQVDMEKVS